MPTKLAPWALVGISAAVLTAGGVAHSAAKAIAAPVLTAKPLAATTSASATFAWSGPANATFQCALDTAAFTSCSSPTTYAGLTQGGHAFQVRSAVGAERSPATSYSWTIDSTPPTAPTIIGKPAAASTSTSASFSFSHPESGVSYQCRLDGAASFASCANPMSYVGLAQGAHSFAVRSLDAAGNVSSPTPTFSWSIDSVAPPAPVLTQKPTDPAGGATHTFAWTDAEVGVAFECALENAGWFACSSPSSFVVDTTSSGQHQFSVRASDASGNRSSGTSYRWKVVKDVATGGLPFTISGELPLLTLGVWRDLPLKITNPNDVPIYVTQLVVGLPGPGALPGCEGSTNFEVAQADVSPTRPLFVAAGSSVTLPTGGVLAPRVRLKNLPTVNQDACKGRSFSLTYSGTANN